ncbi:MAG TPA: hypothetical protein PLA94_31130, partial [Myxococcota bacterium]|nr:hypothetical protein [Myxococcota bacterium]
PGWYATREELGGELGGPAELSFHTVVVEAVNAGTESGRLSVFYLAHSGELVKEQSCMLAPGTSVALDLHAAQVTSGSSGWIRVNGSDDMVISGYAMYKQRIRLPNSTQELVVEDSRTLLFTERPLVEGTRPVATVEDLQMTPRILRPSRG